jgi:hypothetical protein
MCFLFFDFSRPGQWGIRLKPWPQSAKQFIEHSPTIHTWVYLNKYNILNIILYLPKLSIVSQQKYGLLNNDLQCLVLKSDNRRSVPLVWRLNHKHKITEALNQCHNTLKIYSSTQLGKKLVYWIFYSSLKFQTVESASLSGIFNASKFRYVASR